MKVHNIYERGPRVQVFFPEDEGRTRQEMKNECDINRIMARYIKTGAIDHVAKHSGDYGDLSAMDYHTALNIQLKAEAMFQDLPATLRSELGNDPGAFLEFCADEANAESLEAHGLLREGNSVAIAREASEAAAAAVLAASAAPIERQPIH